MSLNLPIRVRDTSNIPDGQERLATQIERDEVSSILSAPRPIKASVSHSPVGVTRMLNNDANPFLLCALITESSRQIKASAGRAGQQLSMARIVHGVLRSYKRAATSGMGPLSGSNMDVACVHDLNEAVFKDEMHRIALEKGTVRSASE
jgi:hypothetical protein